MTAQELIGKYVGSQKIQSISEPDETGLVTATFDDGKTLPIILTVLEGWTTENPTDESTLRDLRVIPLVVEIYNAMIKHQSRVRDFSYLLEVKLKGTLIDLEEKAGEVIYGKERLDLTISDFEKVITKNI